MHQNKVVYLLLLLIISIIVYPLVSIICDFLLFFCCPPPKILPSGPMHKPHLASGVPTSPFRSNALHTGLVFLKPGYTAWGQMGFKRNQGECCLSLLALYSGITTVITWVNENELPRTLIKQINDTQLTSSRAQILKLKVVFLCYTLFFEIMSCKTGHLSLEMHPYPLHPPESEVSGVSHYSQLHDGCVSRVVLIQQISTRYVKTEFSSE